MVTALCQLLLNVIFLRFIVGEGPSRDKYFVKIFPSPSLPIGFFHTLYFSLFSSLFQLVRNLQGFKVVLSQQYNNRKLC